MCKEGAGIALGSLKLGENPLDTVAGVSQVEILGNNIQGMSNSGISTVADAEGKNNNPGIGDVQDLTIAHNRIVGCARGRVDQFFDPEAVGGIVLREVAQVRIHDNYIADNGIGKNSACGIFVNDCQGLEIANNTILDNGYIGEQAERDNDLVTYQAGIVVLGATSNQSPPSAKKAMSFENAALEQQLGEFAVRIHDNVVICPQGQALIVLGLGSMSIIGNTLTSQGIRQQPSPLFNTLGRCVAIGNSGQMPLGSGFASFGLKSTFDIKRNYHPSTYATKLSQSPDGRVVFHSNQVTLRVAKPTEPLVYNAVAIISFDDISLQDNQVSSEISGQGTLTLDKNSYTVPPLLIDVFTLAPTVRASGNRFTELPLGALFSYGALGWLNSATGNQTTHCLLIQGGQVINTPNQILIDTFCPNLQFISNPG
jgi:hypothetical protein